MARLVQLRSTCNHGNKCPTLHYQPDSGEFLVQGYTGRWHDRSAAGVACDSLLCGIDAGEAILQPGVAKLVDRTGLA